MLEFSPVSDLLELSLRKNTFEFGGSHHARSTTICINFRGVGGVCVVLCVASGFQCAPTVFCFYKTVIKTIADWRSTITAIDTGIAEVPRINFFCVREFSTVIAHWRWTTNHDWTNTASRTVSVFASSAFGTLRCLETVSESWWRHNDISIRFSIVWRDGAARDTAHRTYTTQTAPTTPRDSLSCTILLY